MRSKPLQLDELDWLIIEPLRHDGRRSYTDIARSIGVVKQTVGKRVERLLKHDALVITARVNPVIMGFPLFVSLGVRAESGAAQSVAAQFSRMKEVSYVAHTAGRFDLLVDVYLRDTMALFAFLYGRIPKVDGVVDCTNWIVVRSRKHSYMWHEENGSQSQHFGPSLDTEVGDGDGDGRAGAWSPALASPVVDLNDLEHRIVQLLRADGRRSFANMARELDVSEPTVAKYVERLFNARAIQVTARLKPAVIGFPIQVSVAIQAKAGRVEEIGAKLAAMQNATYVGYTTGAFNIVMEAFLRDDEDLFHFLNAKLASIDGIEAKETWTILRVEKLNSMWEGENIT
jgi:DNA-binding Lrp family transcriptional regulator